MQSDKVDSGIQETSQPTMPADVKERINQLLWYALPESCSIGEAELLAIAIFNKIAGQWQDDQL